MISRSSRNYTLLTKNTETSEDQKYIPFRRNYSKINIKIPKQFKVYERWKEYMVDSLDQQNCGSCWAFATCLSLTERTNILFEKKIFLNSLSPNILIACDSIKDIIDTKAGPRDLSLFNYEKTIRKDLSQYACSGNTLLSACLFLQVYGTTTELCTPYKSENVEFIEYNRTNFGYVSSIYSDVKSIWGTNSSSDTCLSYFSNLGYTLNANNCYGRIINNNSIYVQPIKMFRSLFCYQIYPLTEDSIKKDIMEWGSICTSFVLYSDFYTFNPLKDGVYIHDITDTNIIGGHAVCISGWGDYYDEKKKRNIPFWWIKNSWGNDYGYDGYFRFYRGNNHCEIEENVIGMIPNTFPQNDDELDDVLDILISKYYFEKNITPEYIGFFKKILFTYSLIDFKLQEKLFTNELLQKYPLIDYFFFHIKFPMAFHLNPQNGFSTFMETQCPGLASYKQLETLKNIPKFKNFLKKKK